MNQRITYKTHLRIVAGIFVVMAIVFFTVAYVYCQENPFPLLMGPEHPAPWQTTPLGIVYNAHDFDRGEGFKSNGKPKEREKYVSRKTPKLFMRAGAGHLIVPFQDYAWQMIHLPEDGSPGFVPLEIDRNITRVLNIWKACGDRQVAGSSKSITYRQAANTFNVRGLTVELVERQFWSDFWKLWLAGELDGNHIKVVSLGSERLISAPHQASLRKFGDLVGWEAGNALGLSAGLKFDGIAGEVGDQSPCGKIRNQLLFTLAKE